MLFDNGWLLVYPPQATVAWQWFWVSNHIHSPLKWCSWQWHEKNGSCNGSFGHTMPEWVAQQLFLAFFAAVKMLLTAICFVMWCDSIDVMQILCNVMQCDAMQMGALKWAYIAKKEEGGKPWLGFDHSNITHMCLVERLARPSLSQGCQECLCVVGSLWKWFWWLDYKRRSYRDNCMLLCSTCFTKKSKRSETIATMAISKSMHNSDHETTAR